MRNILLAAALAALAAAQQSPVRVPVEERGLKAGESVPAFSLHDQLDTERTLASLTGPKGLVLLFVRSADW